MEGNGIFYWDDGSRWEGTFSNNKLHGEGMFYNPRTKASFAATYRNNRLIDENAGNERGGYGSSMRKNRGDRENNIFKREKERERERERERDVEIIKDSIKQSYKEKENFRKEPETREVGRRILFRGRGKIPQRGRREIVVRETVNNIKPNVNVEPGVDRVVEIEEKVIQRDTGKDLDVRDTDEKLPPIENYDRKFEREVNNSQRFQKREIFRERNQREFERERPRGRESEDNNGEEDEKEEDEDSQNENESAREFGRNRMAEIGNKRFYRGGMRKERFKRKSESDEESYE